MSEITRILDNAPAGGPAAEELLPLVYEELRRLAAQKMSQEPADHTLQPTALVHEVWLRISQQPRARWRNREHFYATAAEVMRRYLVDRARRRRAAKHGGALERLHLDNLELVGPEDDAFVLQVHEALAELEAQDPVKAEVVKLRFFVGLENTEAAAVLGTSEKTVQRHWAFAKAWLYRAHAEGALSARANGSGQGRAKLWLMVAREKKALFDVRFGPRISRIRGDGAKPSRP